MDKELQDQAWAALTDKNRVLCRKMYRTSGDGNVLYLLETLYGVKNLTSDEESPEMLYVEKAKVQKLYEGIHDDYLSNDESLPYFLAQNAESLLKTLFGSKCLPDEEYTTCVHASGTVCVNYDKEYHRCSLHGECKFSLPDDANAKEEPQSQNSAENCDNENYISKSDDMEEKDKIKELFTKENLDEIVSTMLEYTAVITQDVINEASKYKPEEERVFIKGAAWMLYHLVKNRGQRHIYIEADMSLEEAIQHCTEVLPLAETAQCAREHVQLRDWLTELKQYRENKQ